MKNYQHQLAAMAKCPAASKQRKTGIDPGRALISHGCWCGSQLAVVMGDPISYQKILGRTLAVRHYMGGEAKSLKPIENEGELVCTLTQSPSRVGAPSYGFNGVFCCPDSLHSLCIRTREACDVIFVTSDALSQINPDLW